MPCEYVFTLRLIAFPRPGDLQRLRHVGVLRRPAGGPPVQVQVHRARQVRQETGALHETADPGEDLGSRVHQLPEDPDFAGGRADQTHHHPQRGRLAGAVGSEQAQHLTGFDPETDVGDGRHAAGVRLAQADDLQGERSGRSGPVAPGHRWPSDLPSAPRCDRTRPSRIKPITTSDDQHDQCDQGAPPERRPRTPAPRRPAARSARPTPERPGRQPARSARRTPDRSSTGRPRYGIPAST